ncbi:MAG: hypothetical protein Q4G70_01020 [Pseudomonadota bacterium]|nr:hypothetical protein [Pseudomonadota bacterium]
MSRISTFGAVMAFSCLLGACGGDSDTPVGEPQSQQPQPQQPVADPYAKYQGRWMGCNTYTDSTGKAAMKSAKETVEFKGRSVTAITTYHNSSDCSGAAIATSEDSPASRAYEVTPSTELNDTIKVSSPAHVSVTTGPAASKITNPSGAEMWQVTFADGSATQFSVNTAARVSTGQATFSADLRTFKLTSTSGDETVTIEYIRQP